MYLQSSGLKIDQNTAEDMRENSDRQKTKRRRVFITSFPKYMGVKTSSKVL